MLEKLLGQRAFMVACIMNLMSKEFEDLEDLTRFKLSLAEALVKDMESSNSFLLGDEVDKQLLKSIRDMLVKEQAVLELKNILKLGDAF